MLEHVVPGGRMTAKTTGKSEDGAMATVHGDCDAKGANGLNTPVVYPRSAWLQSKMDLEAYLHLVRLSDYNTAKSATASQLASKELMDADRLAVAIEAGYDTAIGKLWPEDASPKNDMLVGGPATLRLFQALG